MICNNCRQGLFHLVRNPVDEWNSETQQNHHQKFLDFQNSLKEGCYICSKYYTSVNPHGMLPQDDVWETVQPLVLKGQRILGDAQRPTWRFCVMAQADADGAETDKSRYWFDLYELKHELMSTHQFSSYVAPARTDEKPALQLAKDWLRHCCESHSQCRKASTVLPTRLMDLQPDDLDDDHWRLIETCNQSIQGVYLTLSHQWGKSCPSKLTVDSCSTLKQGSLICLLSPLYRDAIYITRSLGVRYLWIDSLCVLQDQLDTQIEAGRMAIVYENARCNLSALPADLNTMFVERRHDVYTPSARLLTADQRIDGRDLIINDASSMKDEIKTSPLSRRAWVLQEQVLARRTIYFGGHQLMYHCLCSSASETHPLLRMPGEELQYPWDHLHAPHYQSFRSPTMAAARRRSSVKLEVIPAGHRARSHSDSSATSTSTLFSDVDTEPLQEYLELVEAYTLGQLNRIEDKPLAMAGIATRFGEQLQDRYLCGLWARSLGSCLLWHMQRDFDGTEQTARRAHPDFRGPSWSWFSVNGPVQFRKSPFNGCEATGRPTYYLQEYQVHSLLNVSENPYTSIRPTWVHLRGPTLKFVYDNVNGFGFRVLRPDHSHITEGPYTTNSSNDVNFNDEWKGISINLDVDQRPGHHHDPSTEWDFTAIFLQAHLSKPTPPNISVQLQGLVLVRHPTTKHNVKVPEHMQKHAFFRYCSFSITFGIASLSDRPRWMPLDWCLWDGSAGTIPIYPDHADFVEDVFLF